ncbi:MAG: DUF120 domain-containing protein [Candidatus Micrarchaeota archaeon]|nr:DUF120 domain-containing protein [Candidatus Micrarchaeota archaeon]
MALRTELKKGPLGFLVFLASRGGAARSVAETTLSLAKALGVPQQTVSRWAIDLEKNGFVERGASGYRLTDHGVGELRGIYSVLSAAFGEKRAIRMEGTVVRGFGDGAYYMARKEYVKQFKAKLGFVPFPGTLNLRLKGAEDVAEKMRLAAGGGVKIHGFTEGGRAFGDATCYPAAIVSKKGRVQGAVIMPHRSHYGAEILEFITPLDLKKIGVRNGARVTITAEPA